MIKKLFCACIYLYQGSAVRNLQDHTVVDNDAARLAAYYCNNNADRIIVFDQSNTDEEHELALDTIKKIAIACTSVMPSILGILISVNITSICWLCNTSNAICPLLHSMMV